MSWRALNPPRRSARGGPQKPKKAANASGMQSHTNHEEDRKFLLRMAKHWTT